MQDRWVRKGREGRKKSPLHRRWKAASRLIRSIMSEPMRCVELRSGFSFAHFASFAEPMRFDALHGLLRITRIAAAGGREPYQMRVVADTRMQDRWVRKGREGRKKRPLRRR
jgi:hypothetical protein